MSEIKMNIITAIRGYKIINKQKNTYFTDVTALDISNNKVLLRIIEPLNNEYIGLNDVKNMTNAIKKENCNSAILISKNFTGCALAEMNKERIQYISDDYMPPFDLHELYSAIVDRANCQCQKKCGMVPSIITNCTEKSSEICKSKSLATIAKRHFEEGTVGLLKNDLRVALSLLH